jgi:hypothetical protein
MTTDEASAAALPLRGRIRYLPFPRRNDESMSLARAHAGLVCL